MTAILIVRARETLPESPRESEKLLRSAVETAARSACTDSRSMAIAELGNALRLQGRLGKAEHCFAEARELQALAPLSELLAAELDNLEGSLRRDQRQLGIAHDLLSRAAVGFEKSDFRPGRIGATLNLGEVLRMLGCAQKASELMLDALGRVHPPSEPHLHLIACHNVALCAADAGQAREARDLLHYLEPLYRRSGTAADHARRTWLLGRIARDQGQFEDAAALLARAIDELSAMQNPLLCACAAVDLAEVLLHVERPRELQQLTAAIALVLRAENLHDEVTASMLLLHRALARDAVDTQLLDLVRSRVAAAPVAAS